MVGLPLSGVREATLSESQAQKIWSVGMRCRCPRCGRGKLFQGFLTLAPSCESCGLSYAFADPADGPAFFVMSGVGILVVAYVFAMLAYRKKVR